MSAQSERLKRRLDAIPKAVREAVQPALIKSGQELAGTMEQLAPVDSGDLKDSIHVTPPGQATPSYSQPGGSRVAGDTEVLITVGNSDVRYPHLVEYGTADTVAQPFFWPAFRLNRKRLANRIKRAVRKAVKDAT
ncbi:HK97 gp10 family phage protein [Rhizobium sp. P32RR-XVIII]|uniref:HK97-gp10 family putative phage morphogenesis protein n=1 Tax=Rhizobium sp. P32RR-XVIII TaxID=2726738 RepID=UPI0014565003|nr:HK97-gp10 family putative phage morphogenesis protein [Rhizobium sp. P32RR-XVIII]NLS04614.1 HK97 gp10 family phage protein [Rhizobium sp. P32RR-XVIII]